MNLNDYGKYNIMHIDPFGTLSDRHNNLRPHTESSLDILKEMHTRIYFWSTKGQKKCRELIEYNNWEKYNITVVKKRPKEKMPRGTFFVIDCDEKFAKKFRVCSVLSRYRPTKIGNKASDSSFYVAVLHFWYMMNSIKVKLEKDERHLKGKFFGNARG